MIGQVFGRWTVVGVPNPRRPSRLWARCACGTEREVTRAALTRGLSTGCRSCADFSMTGPRTRRVVNEGDAFGSWTVVREIGHTSIGARLILVRCVCGIEKGQPLGSLTNGSTTRCRQCAARATSGQRKHGRSGTRLHMTWGSMLSRCHNPNSPNFRNYGARGITVHEPWRHDFAAFAAYIDTHLGHRPEHHSLDRIDNSRGYEPGNLRWATHSVQMRNTRRARRLVSDDEVLTLQDIADRVGISREGVRQRLKRGWTVEECLTFGRRERARRAVACGCCGQQGHGTRACPRRSSQAA